jgi:hypothetical protein
MSVTQEAKDGRGEEWLALRGEGVGDRGAAVCVEGDKERPTDMCPEPQSHWAPRRAGFRKIDRTTRTLKCVGPRQKPLRLKLEGPLT